MFFIYVADGLGESSMLSALGPAASVTTLLCVIIVTVAMVLLTLMCVCSKKTGSVKLQNNSAPVAENENRVTLKQLSKTEDIESQLTDANKEETGDGKLTESVPVEGHVPATSTTQLAVAHLKEETRPASHPSPHLPPRNPHNFHAPAHPTNQSSTSVQASSRASTPASVEKIHDDYVANRTTAPASSATAAEGAMAAKESQLPDHSRMNCRVQPDYEEMDLPEKPPPANAKADECDDSNIYQDIDLDQESKSQKTAPKNSDSIEPYAEYKEDSKKSSVVERRPQRKSSSLQTSESEAPTGVQSTTEIPRYAQVDKARKSHNASSNSSLANHLPEDGLVSEEVTSCTGESRSSEPTTNVTELYTQVHKPKGNVVVSNDKDSHISKPHESVNGENSKATDGDMVLNPCYGTPMLRNYPNGTTSGHDSTQPSEIPTLEEPPYSTINDERVIITINQEPGYSSIDEVQGGYSEIASTSQGAVGSGAAANATGVNRSNAPKEPIYELVDATARDDASNQRI